MALVWEEVFGEPSHAKATARLINVIAGQAMSLDQVSRILAPAIWARMEPDTYVDPREVFEEVAIASYFGGHVLRDAKERADFAALLARDEAAARAWLGDQLRDPRSTEQPAACDAALARSGAVGA